MSFQGAGVDDRARELARLWRAHIKGRPTAPVGARIAFAATFTIDPLVDLTGAVLLEAGVENPFLVNANYNQVVRACLYPKAEFGTGDVETVVLLWRLEDVASNDASNAAEAVDMLLRAVQQLRVEMRGQIILALPPRPRGVIEGLVEFSRPSAFQEAWFAAAGRITEFCRANESVYSVDMEALLSELGEGVGLDYRKEVLYRQPYSETYYAHLAERICRLHLGRKFEAKKCLVVDCDNTLWGGVVGEDGVGGVHLSDDHPGRAYLEFQRQIKVLRESGIFLALCTKNNPDDVTEMFENHASMAIRLDDVSISKVNWQPKSENLREIAKELNIGVDALVFVDDNPFEIEEVRTHLPEVTCVQVPEDIADLPPLIGRIARLFDRLDITADDRKRVDMVKKEMERRDLAQKLTEQEFLASLGLQVRLFRPGAAEIARVTQLINKTNQFNVTTRRYTAEQVSSMLADPAIDLFCASVSDKFGDYGLVGVGIVRHGKVESEFDTLLMSCRVLGRGVETVIISHGLTLASERKNSAVIGKFIPTRKNAVVVDLFDKHEFEVLTEIQEEKVYRRSTEPLSVPDFVEVVSPPLAVG